jgi:ribose 5-phosphate isomerase
MDWILEARRAVASASVDLIRNNTVIGIGSGRTVWFVIQALETKVKKENFNIRDPLRRERFAPHQSIREP